VLSCYDTIEVVTAHRTSTPAPLSARALARAELTRAITAEARAQLALVGPASLSVRAVARELGMASSAVYRYFPSRDDLLTALLVVCYNELGGTVERAEAEVAREDLPGRWAAVAHATRGWAVSHPHDFALLFGSPVPGYAAPSATVEPATRVTRLLAALLTEIQQRTDVPEASPTLAHDSLAGLRTFAGAPLSDRLALRGLRAWSGLVGTLTLELYGHFVNAISDLDAYFEEMTRELYPG